MSGSVGTRLGHYRIVALIGAGGMGEVYRAHDDRLDRDVALKLLPAATVGDQNARARLVREARAAAVLNHASICIIHEVGEADGQSYIAMELVEGRPLSDIASGTPLSLKEVVNYGTQIADALAHAHARGVVHRDLKSANVVVSPDGRAKILDFGLAKRSTASDLNPGAAVTQTVLSHTERGTVVGTVAYMAPEQLRGEPADARSDVWALGVMLYEWTAGTRPFGGQSAFEVSSNILSRPPSPLPRAVPLVLQAIVSRCLDKEPARRYQNASDVAAALRDLASGATPPLTALASRSSRRRWATAVALALAGVAASVAYRAIRSPDATALQVQSLAVLPLANLSGDSAQDYFADGITEALSTDLARLGGLKRVTARGSVIRYRGTAKPLDEVARELNVDVLVTGSVVRAGNRMSVTAQLLDPRTGGQLWSNRYERDLQDVLALRNEIVSAIVREIRMTLSPAEQARLASAGRVDIEAFEAYLKGRFHWFKQTREDYDVAERYFQLALAKDPQYALAYAGLGSVWRMRGDAGFQVPRETFPKAKAFMAKALELDDGLADVHVELANHLVSTEWDWAGGEREYRRALEANPNLADAHFFYSDLLLVLQRPDEWNREMQRALELDPLNDFNRTYYGWHLNYLERFDQAIPIFKRLLPTGPNKAANHLGLWGAYYRKGMYDDALASAKEYFTAAGNGEFVGALGAGGGETAYRDGMKRAGEAMVARSSQRHVPAIRIARMFAHAGDADRAFEWLERAYQDHEVAMERIGVVWDWYTLRGDPRFLDLLRRLNLPR